MNRNYDGDGGKISIWNGTNMSQFWRKNGAARERGTREKMEKFREADAIGGGSDEWSATMGVNQVGVFTRVNRFDYPIRGDQRRNVSSRAALRQNRFWICDEVEEEEEEGGGMVACFVEWLGHGMAETGTVATTLP